MLCSESAQNLWRRLPAHSEPYPEFSPWLVGPWVICHPDKLSDLISQHSPLPDSAAVTLTSSTFLSPDKALCLRTFALTVLLVRTLLTSKTHIPNTFALSGGLPWPCCLIQHPDLLCLLIWAFHLTKILFLGPISTCYAKGHYKTWWRNHFLLKMV